MRSTKRLFVQNAVGKIAFIVMHIGVCLNVTAGWDCARIYTVAGHNFTSYVVPGLIDVIEKLTMELKRANDLNERKVKEEQKCVEEQ